MNEGVNMVWEDEEKVLTLLCFLGDCRCHSEGKVQLG